jgi:Ca-activated chloride channel homolog
MLVAFEIQPSSKTLNEIVHVADFCIAYKRPGKTGQLEQKISGNIKPVTFNDLPRFYRFASSVIMFGSLLRESKFINEKSWSDALVMAQQSFDAEDPLQKEFVGLVEKGKAIYTGKKKKKQSSD